MIEGGEFENKEDREEDFIRRGKYEDGGRGRRRRKKDGLNKNGR